MQAKMCSLTSMYLFDSPKEVSAPPTPSPWNAKSHNRTSDGKNVLSSDDGQIEGGVQPNVTDDKWKGAETRSHTHTLTHKHGTEKRAHRATMSSTRCSRKTAKADRRRAQLLRRIFFNAVSTMCKKCINIECNWRLFFTLCNLPFPIFLCRRCTFLTT